jgi:predicted outer membrane protein
MSAGRSISSTAMMVLVGVLGLTVTVGVGALASPASAAAGEELPPGYTNTSSGPIGPADRDLIIRVRLAGLWEMPAGTMARENGTGKVKEIGTKIANEHHELDLATQEIAATLGVTLPDVPNADQQGWLNEMSAAQSGPALDQVFIDRLRAAHGKIFPAIANVRAGTRNSLVRDFAIVANAAVMRHMGYLESSGIVTWSELDFPPVPASTPVDYRRNGTGVDPLVIWLVLGVALVAGLATTVRAVRLR